MSHEEMAAAIRAVFGNNTPIISRDRANGTYTRTFSLDLLGRPGTGLLKELQRNTSKADAFLVGDAEGEEARLVRCSLYRERADTLTKTRRYEAACEDYQKAIVAIVGKDFKTPLAPGDGGGIVSKTYNELSAWERIDLITCCRGMAECASSIHDNHKALNWLLEVEVLNKSMFFANPVPAFEWLSCDVNITEQYSQRIKAFNKASDIFLSLGNTGLAVCNTWSASKATINCPDGVDVSVLRPLIPNRKVAEITQLRHPDPQLTANWELKDDNLQVRGSWEKIHISKSMPPRMGFASFIWNGFFYVAGGEKGLDGPFYRDLWRLDLSKLDQWQQLPSFPQPESISGPFDAWSMAVYEDKAYLFTGRPLVDYFDLVTEQWGTLPTTFKRDSGLKTWPYPRNYMYEYTMQVAKGKLYVFGGVHDDAALGCNLFMGLDIVTGQWERLSGTVLPQADISCPGPRRYTTSWIHPSGDKFMLMFGEAARQTALLQHQANGSTNGYGYDDLWSWDFKKRVWQRERIVGNPPCPRSEMAVTMNHMLQQAVVFGGYSPTLPTCFPVKNETFSFTYYADTFILDYTCSPPRWKQVLTRGFPTYRAQAQLLTDPSTGKIFLFGGFTNMDFVPSRKSAITRSFGDLWQLRVNVPGGFFEDVDLEEEARTSKAGPYQRCFTCGSAGQWKKCGGSCNGRAFFCDSPCLKEGWKEHKNRHKCKKKGAA